MSLDKIQWNRLLTSIEKKECTPFIGAGAAGQWLPLAIQIAGKWSEEYNYPLDDVKDLSKVAQFLAIIKEDDLYPKERFGDLIRDIQPPNFSLDENRNTSYAVLADLNLPIYITTNYDYFMEEALASNGKSPVTEFCRWSQNLINFAKEADYKSVFDKKYEPNEKIKYIPKTKPYKPAPAQPLVYHLHGIIDIPQSMVLTEKDYFDFVIQLNQLGDSVVYPPEIRTKLVTTFLLFIGYRLEDIIFRVIFQGVLSILDRSSIASMAVQIPTSFPEDKQEEVKNYLNSYIKTMYKIDTYSSNLDQFSTTLHNKVDESKSNRS